MTTATASINATASARAATAAMHQEWQIDRARKMASHISGLSVTWQAPARGRRNAQPALDIAGLEKVNAGPWAARIDTLVTQAIALLERNSG